MPEAGSNTREGRRNELLGNLRKYGYFIESKFKSARQFDIDAEYVKTILKDVTKLVDRYPETESEKTDALQNLCPSAISLYYEPDNRPFFFKQVETIGALLRKL